MNVWINFHVFTGNENPQNEITTLDWLLKTQNIEKPEGLQRKIAEYLEIQACTSCIIINKMIAAKVPQLSMDRGLNTWLSPTAVYKIKYCQIRNETIYFVNEDMVCALSHLGSAGESRLCISIFDLQRQTSFPGTEWCHQGRAPRMARPQSGMDPRAVLLPVPSCQSRQHRLEQEHEMPSGPR